MPGCVRVAASSARLSRSARHGVLGCVGVLLGCPLQPQTGPRGVLGFARLAVLVCSVRPSLCSLDGLGCNHPRVERPEVDQPVTRAGLRNSPDAGQVGRARLALAVALAGGSEGAPGALLAFAT